ncbi:putative flavin-containing monooxygenase [Gordonia effusa NBRC 100432]|uniref:Putative flavin-containing monooxygenase n=1 Tax=Gordonia effusa NBRC 100432 TaxID=1077974 RepID=H0R3X0_9ACTN|nr:NAD(P)/FAD-dependent oxidoreductase [Gordonia effusa]GAB19771.1 putative flavin-containing monooxygenase [Gordonia effusa NBRC 100432]
MTAGRDIDNSPEFEVAVIGAGPAGIAAGAKLRMAGIDDFVILERADDVGGSWHENHYPGLGVDIPGIAYQYSFARNPNWSRFFPLGAEVKQYHVDVARRFGLPERTRFNSEVEREVWDDDAKVWRLHLAGGNEVRARFLISAVGAFVRPKDDVGIPGANSFRGKVLRPSSWDHSYDITGKRVAIIGTGASAVQIIPSIAPQVDHLTVFQRTPVWSIPKPDFEVPRILQRALAIPGLTAAVHGAALVVVDALLRLLVRSPGALVEPVMDRFDATTIALYRRYVRWVIDDPAVAAKLSPNFGALAKRPTMSTAYLRAYNRDNVDLCTEPIVKITQTGVRTSDGVLHKVDALVLATGYEVFSDPETYRVGTIVGRDGFDLADFYSSEGLQAYQSVSVHGLPNRWTLVGPYSWTGSGWHAFAEMTADHAVRAITESHRRSAQVCEIRKQAADDYHREVFSRASSLRYYLNDLNGHVPTYYRNSQGDSTYIRPSGFFEASRGNRRFPLDDYSYENFSQVPNNRTDPGPGRGASEIEQGAAINEHKKETAK